MPLIDDDAMKEVGDRLTELIGDGALLAQSEADCRAETQGDGLFEVLGFSFAVAYKNAAGAAPVAAAVGQAKLQASRLSDKAIPLVAVPFMGETGQRLCEDAGVSWLDLSGNARIKTPGLRIWIEGRPNRFKERGRPSNVFAPKSARIARWLLIHPDEAKSQRELAQETDMDEGQTSRIISRLLKDGLVLRDGQGLIRVQDRALLLDAWHEVYDFSKHQILKGHVVARSGPELSMRLAKTFESHDLPYAMTGLTAAWQLTQFAGFRLNTVYLQRRPDQATLDELGFREEERGANTWLVLPNDTGVFQGAKSQDGVRRVHPVQVYMDLKGLHERAPEAAVHLRDAILKGSLDV